MDSADRSSRRAWRRLGRAGRPRTTKATVLATLLALARSPSRSQ